MGPPTQIQARHNPLPTMNPDLDIASDPLMGARSKSPLRSMLALFRSSWSRLEPADRQRLVRLQVSLTQPAMATVMVGGALLLILLGCMELLGWVAGIGYRPAVTIAVGCALALVPMVVWWLSRWYLRVGLLLAYTSVLAVFLSIPVPGEIPQLAFRTGLFNMLPIAILALLVRRRAMAVFIVLVLLLSLVRVRVHGAPAAGETLYWFYIFATLGFGWMLRRYRSEFAARAYLQSMELWRQARTDPLTGLLNRSGWEGLASRALAAEPVRHATRPGCLVFLDIDHFKQVNDTHGHQAGDDALAALGRIIRHRQGKGYVAARLGGEEFVVLACHASLQEAWRFAERVRADFALAQEALGCTLSGGLAERLPGESLSSMLRRADDALYRAKSTGRDRLLVARAGAAAEEGQPAGSAA